MVDAGGVVGEAARKNNSKRGEIHVIEEKGKEHDMRHM